jgi:hypothetical protein
MPRWCSHASGKKKIAAQNSVMQPAKERKKWQAMQPAKEKKRHVARKKRVWGQTQNPQGRYSVLSVFMCFHALILEN